MGLRTTLLLMVVLSISFSYGKNFEKKIASASVRMADGTRGAKSMEVIKKQAAYLSNKDKYVIKGPPCDKDFSWTYVRPGTSMKIRSRWLGKAMNFPDICGWSFWSEGRNRVVISCGSVDIRDTDYLQAYDLDRSVNIGVWQGVTIEDFEIDAITRGVAFGLESNQVRDKRSFECTVAAVYSHCGHGTNAGFFDCGDGKCIPAEFRCDGSPSCDNQSDESLEICNENAPSCGEQWITCDNGKCIDPLNICTLGDSSRCADGADKENCPAHGCSRAQFVCGSGDCVDYNLICDKNKDCPEGEDEDNCGSNDCPGGYFRCDDGKCKASFLVCSGTGFCSNDEDDLGCFHFVNP